MPANAKVKNVIISWVDFENPRKVSNPTMQVANPDYYMIGGVGVGYPTMESPTPEDEQVSVENRLSLIIDCTTAGEISGAPTVSKHPIEDGSLISDHIVTTPKQFNMSGIISNHPILAGTAGENDVSFKSAPFYGVNQMVVNYSGGTDASDENRAKSAYDMLMDIVSNKRVCRIVSDLEVLENMAVTKYSFPRSSRTANSLEFSLTFEQISVVSSEYTTASVKAKKVDKKVAKTVEKKNNGEQPPKKVNNDTELNKLRKKVSEQKNGEEYYEYGSTAPQSKP